MRFSRFRSVLFLVFWVLLGSEAWAVTPDAGAILQQIEQEKRLRPSIPAFQRKTTPDSLSVDRNAIRVLIKSIEFRGNINVSTEDLATWFSSYLGKEYTFAGLERLALQVGEFYRGKGMWAKGVLPEQTLENGLLIIQIVEGKLGEVLIKHKEDKLNFSLPKSYEFLYYGQDKEGLFNIQSFQRAIKNLDNVPGVTASAVLQPGKEIGYTDVLVNMANTPLESGSVRLDNHASRSTSWNGLRVTGYLNLDGLLKQGEQINGQIVHSEGTDVITLGGTMPFGSDGSRMGGNLTALRYSLGEPLQALQAKGDSQVLDVFIDKSLRNDEKAIIRARVDLAKKAFKNELSGSTSSEKDIHTLGGTLVASWPDRWLGGSTNIFSTTLRLGDLDLNGYADAAGAEGAYKKLTVLFNRAQYVSEKNEFFLAFTGQYAGKNLESSEKISLGGPTSVRAYPVGEASGDHGAILTLELRHQLDEDIQGLLFYDHGWVNQDRDDYNGQSTPSEIQLKGLGVGVKWQLDGEVEFVGSLSSRLGSNPAADASGHDGDATKRDPRLWFSLVKQF